MTERGKLWDTMKVKVYNGGRENKKLREELK